jgi:UDP-N-acetylmuramoyl-tripeptide--D-alanyl-D-alanine ligase
VSRTVLKLTAAEVAWATEGRLRSGSPEMTLDGFAIDSRTIAAGDLFFAIVAARDGHEFVADAFARGASGAVIAREVAVDVDQTRLLIDVEDTTVALQALGQHVRRASGAKVIAITGSAGKTTTKEVIAAFLAGRYHVAKNEGNLNNHLGLPLSLLELRHGADVAVLELGMNHTGEIRLLVGLAEPEVRVWINVGDAHLGHFKSQEEIADAKAEILEGAGPTDLLIMNADDPRVVERASSFRGRTVSFGVSTRADIRATAIEDRGIDGTRVRVSTPSAETVMDIPLLGRGNVANVLAATAVATELGVSLDEIAACAARLQPAQHRGAVVRLPAGITVVDDSYNSNPSALRKALDVMARETRAPRKAAVLGEMRELGEHSMRLHQECGRAAAAAGLHRLITVGGSAAKALADAAVAAGMAADSVTVTDTSDAAADLIVSWLTPGDLVLVKGSRSIKTEAVVDRIAAEFA